MHWNHRDLYRHPAGDSVFIDANIFVFNFAPDPVLGPACNSLLTRIEVSDIVGITSSHVLTDTSHRLMTLEACQTFGWPYAGIAQRLRRHAGQIQQLYKFRQAIEHILTIGVQVVPVNEQHVLHSGDLARQHGLLTGDALVVAVMQSEGLTSVTSNDGDFDGIPGMNRFKPL